MNLCVQRCPSGTPSWSMRLPNDFQSCVLCCTMLFYPTLFYSTLSPSSVSRALRCPLVIKLLDSPSSRLLIVRGVYASPQPQVGPQADLVQPRCFTAVVGDHDIVEILASRRRHCSIGSLRHKVSRDLYVCVCIYSIAMVPSRKPVSSQHRGALALLRLEIRRWARGSNPRAES